MKIILNINILIFLSQVYAQEKIRISYNGFFQDRLEKNISKLEFEITNLTKDTLYLSEDNIQFKVVRNRQILKDEQKKNSVGTAFVRPRIVECPENQNLKQSLARKYAKKLALKNRIDESDLEEAIQKITLACIVVFPEERIYTIKILNNSQFDKKCEVNCKYVNHNIFTSTRNNKHELIEIKI